MSNQERLDGPLRGASAPRRPLPPGAWDCHTHVFGPFERYPLMADARYRPPLAPKEMHTAVLTGAGLNRSVVVHASANGFDNSAVVDAVAAAPGRLLAVAVVPESTGSDEFAKLHAAGVRGLRYTETGAQLSQTKVAGILGLADLRRMLPLLKQLGWHAQIWAKCQHLVSASGWLSDCGVPVVLDHMGAFDVNEGLNSADFIGLKNLLNARNIWVKLTSTRITKLRWSDCSDVRPFHDALLEHAPDRMIWGSDWPYIGMDADLPNIGAQIDLFDSWVADETLRSQVFVENARRLYAPE